MFDYDSVILRNCHAVFAEAVLYRTATGMRFTINGIFDEAYHEVEGGDIGGAPIATLRPVLGVRLIEFPVWPPAQHDKVEIIAQNGHGGGVFEVKTYEPDGKGAAKLMLQRLSRY